MAQKLRWSVGIGFAALLLLLGWQVAFAAAFAAFALAFVCMGLGDYAERAWLWMTLALIVAVFITVLPARQGCDADSPAGCSVRVW